MEKIYVIIQRTSDKNQESVTASDAYLEVRQNCVNLCCCCFTFHISLRSGRPPPGSGRRRVGTHTRRSRRPRSRLFRHPGSSLQRCLAASGGRCGPRSSAAWRLSRGSVFLRSLQESLSNPHLHREERPTRVTTGVWRKSTQKLQKARREWAACLIGVSRFAMPGI